MNDLRKYPREFITEFIELYKSLPAVWKVKSKEYGNRDMKAKAYNILVEKWKEVEPTADREFVVKKINSMRTIYRRQLKKLGNEHSGGDTEDPSCPNLWYFRLLDFLRDQECLKPLNSSFEQEKTQAIKNLEPVSDAYEFTPEVYIKTESPSPAQSSSESTEPPPSPIPSCSKKRRVTNRTPKSSTQLEEPKLDRFDYVGKIWAETLRSLPKEQRIYAEKMINDILFEAQLNALNQEDVRRPASEQFIEIKLEDRK